MRRPPPLAAQRTFFGARLFSFGFLQSGDSVPSFLATREDFPSNPARTGWVFALLTLLPGDPPERRFFRVFWHERVHVCSVSEALPFLILGLPLF